MLQPKKAYHQQRYLIANAPVSCLLGTAETQEPPLNQTLTLPRLPLSKKIAKPRAHPTCRPGGATPMLTSNTSSHPWHCVQDVGRLLPLVPAATASLLEMMLQSIFMLISHGTIAPMIPMAVRTSVSWRGTTRALFLFALVSKLFHTSVFVI